MNDIEKCAKLMGYEEFKLINGSLYYGKNYHELFNPRTNKSDLMDLECEIGIDVGWFSKLVMASTKKDDEYLESRGRYIDHPTKFAARAEAVIAVSVQIYDAKCGKDGE